MEEKCIKPMHAGITIPFAGKVYTSLTKVVLNPMHVACRRCTSTCQGWSVGARCRRSSPQAAAACCRACQKTWAHCPLAVHLLCRIFEDGCALNRVSFVSFYVICVREGNRHALIQLRKERAREDPKLLTFSLFFSHVPVISHLVSLTQKVHLVG